KEAVEIVLGYMDLDLVLWEKEPISTMDNLQEVRIEKWEHSNRMCLMTMKHSILEAFWGFISESQSANIFLEEIEQFFSKNEKANTNNLLAKLIFMKYKGRGNIREYIMEVFNLSTKLKSLKLELDEDLIVHLVLIPLPAHFEQFKVRYNTQKDKWFLNELISHYVQEEERLQRDKIESAHFASTSQNKKRKNIKGTIEGSSQIKFRYGYLYLILEKSQPLDIFKSFKAKVIKYDRDGEYYGRYDESREQRLGPFVLFLKVWNFSAIHHNHPYGETLKTTIYILNRVPTKVVNKISYELFGLTKSRISNICTFGVVQLKHDLIGRMKENWIQESFFEMGNVEIVEEVEFGKEENIRNVVFDEESVNDIGQVLVRYIRERRHAILDNYFVFLQEHEDDIGLIEDDLINFCQAMQSFNSQKWIDVMKYELKFIQDNDVWDLVELPEGGNIERYKARLVAKDFTQKEGIDYKEIFYPVSSKDSFQTIMALVAHFDLKLY
ncbi:hypothetical protein CR513_03890, partial [Mucuna pruriens]